MKPKSGRYFDSEDGIISFLRMALIQATGADMDTARTGPFIAVASSQTDLNPGHMHLSALAARVKEGVIAAGGLPFEFNVPAPCDGMAEGHEGMRFILPQRELIADTVETHVRSMLFDGLVLIASCDKIVPGMLMAAARLDLPTILLSGGPNAWQVRHVPGAIHSVDSKDHAGTPHLMACCTAASAVRARSWVPPTPSSAWARRWACACPAPRTFRRFTRTGCALRENGPAHRRAGRGGFDGAAGAHARGAAQCRHGGPGHRRFHQQHAAPAGARPRAGPGTPAGRLQRVQPADPNAPVHLAQRAARHCGPVGSRRGRSRF